MRRWKPVRRLASTSGLIEERGSQPRRVRTCSNDLILHRMALLASLFAVLAGAEEACLLQTKGREVTYDLAAAGQVQCDRGSATRYCLAADVCAQEEYTFASWEPKLYSLNERVGGVTITDFTKGSTFCSRPAILNEATRLEMLELSVLLLVGPTVGA